MAAGNEELNVSELKKVLFKPDIPLENIVDTEMASSYQGFYRFIINILTEIDLDEEEARNHYYRIMDHKVNLSDKMGRDVGLRVAAMDYFLNVFKILKNPKIIEIDFFEEILKLTKEDSKTSCYNSSFIADMAEKEINRAYRYHHKMSLIIIDIDDFKKINDSYGHIAGDRVLKEFASILNKSVRKEDIVGRFGGDEFIILLPQTGRIGARFLAERIKQNLELFYSKKNNLDIDKPVTFSAGISTYPLDSINYEGLVKKADASLYKSKFLGKNKIYDYLEEEKLKDSTLPFERRRFTRYSVGNDSEVEITDKNALMTVKGKVLNISPVGLLIECSCRLTDDNNIKKNLELQIKRLGEQPLKDLNIRTSISQFRKENDNLRFYLDLEFNNIIDVEKWKSIEEYGGLLPL